MAARNGDTGRLLHQRGEAASTTGSTSLFSTSANLVLTVLGAGQLTLPYAMSKLGLAFGLLSLSVFVLLGMHSLNTLAFHQEVLKSADYAELTVHAIGNAGKVICRVLVSLYAWGGALSFLVILKAELGFLANKVQLNAGGGMLMLILAAAFIWPMSSWEDLSKLKRTSPLGCVAAIVVTVMVLSCTPWGQDPDDGSSQLFVDACHGPVSASAPLRSAVLEWWPQNAVDTAAVLPLLSFALNSSWAFLPTMKTMRERTASRVSVLILAASTVIAINYFLIAAFGYLTFCSKVQPNILDSYDSTRNDGLGVFVVVARAMVAVQLTLALPMRFHVARTTALGGRNVLFGIQGLKLRASVGLLLVASAAGLAALPLPLATVLGLTSSVCASMIIYILPAFLDLKLQLPGVLRKATSVLSLLVGAFVLAGGLASNVMGTAVGS